MAAYAALTSLMNIIHQLQHHPTPPIFIDQQQLESLSKNVTSLQEFLETTYQSPVADGDEADPLEMRIADAAREAEDVIESNIVDMIELRRSTATISPADKEDPLEMRITLAAYAAEVVMRAHFIDLLRMKLGRCTISPYQSECLHKVIIKMNLINKEIKKEKTYDAVEAQLHRNVSTTVVSSKSSIMVGFNDEFLEILDKLTAGESHRQFIPIVRMGGIGKTTLARHVYAHPFVKDRFDICAWATISQQYKTKEILCELLCQANRKSKEELSYMSEDELGLALYQYLTSRRFLILMDDVWSIEAWEKMQNYFPDNDNGSWIVVTTRLSRLGSQLNKYYCLTLKFLDESSSWELMSKIVFGKGSCPSELKEIGKKIAGTCRGLPLSIVVMGGLLKNIEHTQEYWKSISKSSSSVGNLENEDFCLRILKMSYNHLPVYLKPCFLYMGVFEEDRAVRVSTLVKLWVSEGFLKPKSDKSLKTAAKEYLNDLVDRNLILVHELGCTGNIKYCKLHDLLRDLCRREAGKGGFYNVIGQHKFEGINSQRRCVVIPRSTSNEEVDDALRSMTVLRSFMYHTKEVLPLPESRLLRVLNAYDRDIYVYLFDDLFKFLNLRYLVIGVDWESKFHSLASFLWNLQTLIVFHSKEFTAPIEIWVMSQLRHVEFHKGVLCLPGLPSGNLIIMENLQTLKGVNDLNFDNAHKVFPDIKKLGVGDIPCNLVCLSKLESFHCWSTSLLEY